MTRTPDEPRRPSDSLTDLSDDAGSLRRLAAWCYRHRRVVVLGWVALLVGAIVVVTVAGTSYDTRYGGIRSEAEKARDLLRERYPTEAGDSATIMFKVSSDIAREDVIARLTPITVPKRREQITALANQVRAIPHVVSVRTPFDEDGAGQVGKHGEFAFASVQFDQPSADVPLESIQKVVDTAQAANGEGLQVEVGGSPVARVVKVPSSSAENYGIIGAAIILLIAFGSIIAMGLPIITALFGISIGILFGALASHVLVTPSVGPELAGMIGLGVGIDYALFIVTRYRQALADGRSPHAALLSAMDTSGRAVLFAGCTVVFSLLGMLLLGQAFVYGLAFGSIMAVLMVLAASLTLLPALLGFAGRSIDRFKLPRLHSIADPSQARDSFWYRWSRLIQRKPQISAASALVALLVLSIPVFSMQQLFADSGNDSTELTTRRAYDLMSEGFGAGGNGPLIIAVDLSGSDPNVMDQVYAQVSVVPNVAFATQGKLNPAGDVGLIVLIPRTTAQSTETEHLVSLLRDQVLPQALVNTTAKAYVGGVTAAGIDTAVSFSGRLYWVIGGVVLLSFLLLMAVFRSVAVPIKAAVMNLLSIGAAYGVIVAVFQWGWLGPLLGIERTGPIDPWIPLMLFTILFGLSMDYEVFLLSRIREEWLRTGDNASAVADGLARTGRVITAAAAIMFCVFGSFVLSDIRVLKVFGLGLAVAVLIDATIVRMVLVPATMELLGDKNWWFPAWLDRLIPNLDIEGEDAVDRSARRSRRAGSTRPDSPPSAPSAPGEIHPRPA